MDATTGTAVNHVPQGERWIGAARKALAVALGAAMLTGCAKLEAAQQPAHLPTSSRLTTVPTPELGDATSIKLDTICDHSAELTPEDCQVLPSILEDTTYESSEGMVIAEVTKDGDRRFDHLSETYRAALEEALQDPLVRYVMKELKTPLVFSMIDDGMSNGEYIPDQSPGTGGSIEITLNRKNGGTDLLPTRGALKAILIHEATHALYHMLVREAEHNPKLKAAMQGMLSACNDELEQVVQLEESENGDNYTKNLELLRASLQYQQITDPQILAPFSVDGKTYIASLFNKESCGIMSAKDLLGKNGVSEDAYKQLQQAHPAAAGEMENLSLTYSFGLHYEYTTEGYALKGLAATYQGHVADNGNELFASTLVTILLSAEGYIQDVKALPADRRKNISQRLLYMGDMFSASNPNTSIPLFKDLAQCLQKVSDEVA